MKLHHAFPCYNSLFFEGEQGLTGIDTMNAPVDKITIFTIGTCKITPFAHDRIYTQSQKGTVFTYVHTGITLVILNSRLKSGKIAL